jgi:ribosomal protein S18 acetylase RimI-like enzyme
VDEAWDFTGHLQPQSIAEFGKRFYTLGSLAESNYAVVVEEAGAVVGFLFGRAGSHAKVGTPYSGPAGRLRLLGEFIRLRGLSPGDKWRWFKAINRHRVNRARVGIKIKDEVTLFAVDASARGKGYGRQMMSQFVGRCRELGVERIVVETDSDSSFGFYDAFGFQVVGEFASPMNELFMGSSGPSWLYVLGLSATTE